MAPRLPSLNALRAFEAAARHNGFIGAAEELCVTRGAVSRHVKLLEETLGVTLFHRHAKGVDLTEAGARLQPVLQDAFARIASGLDILGQSGRELRVICPPTISMRWLIPRLEKFQALHPGIEVRLSTRFYGAGGFDPLDNDIGFSVMNWPGRAPGIAAIALFPVLETPACAPDFMAGDTSLRSVSDLGARRLLHEGLGQTSWDAWLTTFGGPQIRADRADSFPNLDMASSAAVMGLGVVLADLVLNRQEFDSGTLVAPFPDKITQGRHGEYCLLIGDHKRDDPKVAAFENWAVAEAEQDRVYCARFLTEKGAPQERL